MQPKKFVPTAALVAGLALGVTFSPSVRSSIANAQTPPPTATATAGAKSTLKTLFLDKLATALNIQRPTLDTAIKTAATGTADEAVKQGRLTQQQADQLKANIQNGQFDGFSGGFDGHHGDRQFGAVRQAMIDAAATTLKVTASELTQQLRNGQTVAQLAQAHGTTEQAVTSAALAAAKTQLDQEVKQGTVTQAQADSMYIQLQQQGSQLFSGRGFGGRGPRGSGNTPQNPATPTTPQAPAATGGA